MDLTGIDFSQWVDIVGELEAQEIHSAGSFTADVLAKADGLEDDGDTLMWSKSHDKFKLRRGEVSIWGGYNGSRKSMFLGFVMLAQAIQHERRVAIASLEMKPAETLYRMAKQASGVEAPSREFVSRFMAWADKYIYIYDQLDVVATEKLHGFINYCVKELHIDHIVIDSLAKAGIGFENRVGEEQFINRLAFQAKHLGCHIHLVAHARKPMSDQSDDRPPTKYSIRGASSLVDMVDNVIILHSSKKREAMKLLPVLDDKQQEWFNKNHDFLMLVEKQRHGSFEGIIGLYTHPSLQFTSKEGRPHPLNFEDKWLTDTAKVVHNHQQFPQEEKV